MAVLVGGRLNEVPDDSNSGLPVDVTDDLKALGCLTCRDLDELRDVLASNGIIKTTAACS
jgi:hypothetical protein